MPDNLEAMKDMMNVEFDRDFVREDGLMNKYGQDEDRDPEPLADSIKRFMATKLENAYRRGKADGMAEEAIGCDGHCMMERNQSWNLALAVAKEAMPGDQDGKYEDSDYWIGRSDYKAEALSAIDGLRKQ